MSEDGAFFIFHNNQATTNSYECAICDDLATHTEEEMVSHINTYHKPFKCTGCGEEEQTFFDQDTCSISHEIEIEAMEVDMEALSTKTKCKPMLSKNLKKKATSSLSNINNLKKIFK